MPRRSLLPLVLLLACDSSPAQPQPAPKDSPSPATPPPAASAGGAASAGASAPTDPATSPSVTPPAADPAASKVVWWCTCYALTDGEAITACRSEQGDCKGLEKRATGGGHGIARGSLTHLCREVRGDHPGDALGGRDKWQPSKKPGAWISHGACQISGPPDAPPPPESPDDSFALLKNERLGTLKLGLGSAELVATLGEPTTKGHPELWGADAAYHVSWSYADKGLVLDLAGSKRSGPFTLSSIDAKAPCDLKSARGVGIGDDRSAVEAAYGKDRDPDSEPGDASFVAGSIYGGVIFTFDPKTKKVTEIFFGAAAE